MLCFREDHHSILPSYTVDLLTLSERVSNVKDIHFLHGYNNPTLFILYEPTPTWAGLVHSYLVSRSSTSPSPVVSPCYPCPPLSPHVPPVSYRRITLRMDTHCMVAISLNTSEKQSPVIWHNKSLPFDACYALPVPRPVGACVYVCMCVHACVTWL